MTSLDKNLSEIFDVEPTKSEPELTPIVPIDNAGAVVPMEPINADDAEMEEDYRQIRADQAALVMKGKIALDCALDIVQQSDQPRAIEVFSTLLGQLSKINEDRLSVHEKRRNIKNARPESTEGPKTVNNNAIFVGSTSELNKMIEKMTGTKPDAT